MGDPLIWDSETPLAKFVDFGYSFVGRVSLKDVSDTFKTQSWLLHNEHQLDNSIVLLKDMTPADLSKMVEAFALAGGRKKRGKRDRRFRSNFFKICGPDTVPRRK
jgi:hypothetical protein